MTDTTSSVGPANQTQIPASVLNLPSSIAPNGAITSNLIAAQGYSKIAIGLTLSQSGTVSIQRYLDAQGAVRVGPPSTLAVTAGQQSSLTVDDGQLFGSFEVVIINGANATSLISDLAVVVASDPASLPGVSFGSYDIATSTAISVPLQAGGAVLLTPNPSAKARILRCPRTNAAPIWVSFGSNPVSGQGVFDMAPGDIYEMTAAQGNLYQGVITGISDSEASGPQTILVTEGVQA